MRRWLLLLFLITTGVDWPHLPFNARFTDVAFVAAAAAVALGHSRWSRPRLSALDLAIVGYIAGSLPAVIFSPDQRASGIELVRQLYLVAIYLVIAMAVRQGFARTVAEGLGLSGAVLAAIGLIAVAAYYLSGAHTAAMTPVMTLPYVGATLRLRALTASEAMLACLLAMSVPFVLLHPRVVASRRRAAAAGGVLGLAALLTYSHSVAGVAVSTVIATWRWLRSRPPLGRAAITATAVIVLALNFAASFSIREIGSSPFRDDTVFHYAVDRGSTEIAGVTIEYQTMSYLRLKQVAMDAFRSHPITGIGLDRFHDATQIAAAQGRLTEPYRNIDPHSSFFGRFAEAGMIGGVTLIALWITIAITLDRLLARDRDHWIAAAATAGIVGTLVNSMNADIMNFRFLWAALGLVRGLMSLGDQATSIDSGREV
jgi:hypothetical protein